MDESALTGIETAVEILRQTGAKEVYVFGSVAEGTDTPDSDIDLAVSGLPPETYFQTVGRIAMAVPRRVDVIDMDEPTPFMSYLRQKGKLKRVA